MLNIMVPPKDWGQHLENKFIKIRCDNLAVVLVLQEVRARDSILATGFLHLYLIFSLKSLVSLVKIIILQTSYRIGGSHMIGNKN